jgi:hypothetical protein
MQITAIDDQLDLFRVTDAVSSALAHQVLATDWNSLPWAKQQGQERWRRRRINDTAIPWINQWHTELQLLWPQIQQHIGIQLCSYSGTAFWLDEPGFVCNMHTDGEMPGSLHLTWIGPATCFYWYKNPTAVRYQVPAESNTGYLMINQADSSGYRKLLWHDMTTPVRPNTFRLTTYTWINPILQN